MRRVIDVSRSWPSGARCASRGAVTPLSSSPDAACAAPVAGDHAAQDPAPHEVQVVTLDGQRVVKAEADGSYANVVHPLNADLATTPDPALALAGRSLSGERPICRSSPATTSRPRSACCSTFRWIALRFFDRLKIELGRRLFKLDLPAATVCYLWDRTLAPGTWLPNVYTDRVRMLVLRSEAAGEQGRWFEERRDLRADFERAFGAEADGGLPPVSAIAFASDADNTGRQRARLLRRHRAGA